MASTFHRLSDFPPIIEFLRESKRNESINLLVNSFLGVLVDTVRLYVTPP